MKTEFSAIIEKIGLQNEKLVFLTGDLGFMALENVQRSLQGRFINVGVGEQNLISLAAGLAAEGYAPICYSIAPFSIFRPFEQIRLDICLHNMNVKIIGNGGGYGYGIMGATHHALEDFAVLSCLPNMTCYVPFCAEDVVETVKAMMKKTGPGYLRLGSGKKPAGLKLPAYQPIRKISSGEKITVVGIGPVVLNALAAIEAAGKKSDIDLFVVSELPFADFSDELAASLKKTKKIMVIEEHVQRGGLGEFLALKILEKGLVCSFKHFFAVGYPDGLYGSQKYHQKTCGLDQEALLKSIIEYGI